VGLAFALFFNLNAIASITSSIYTIIYLFVLVSHFRLAKEMGGNKIFIAFNISILLFVLLALIYHQWQTEKYGLLAFGVVLLAAISLEFIYRKIRKRSIKDKT
jgi:L-asparagine transporter-like permease